MIGCTHHPGTGPSTQACALTGNWTDDLLLSGMIPNQLSHISQGHNNFVWNWKSEQRIWWGCSFKETESKNSLNWIHFLIHLILYWNFIFHFFQRPYKLFQLQDPPELLSPWQAMDSSAFPHQAPWTTVDSWGFLANPLMGCGKKPKGGMEELRGCHSPWASWINDSRDTPQTEAVWPRASSLNSYVPLLYFWNLMCQGQLWGPC